MSKTKIDYNLKWMDRTFSSQLATQSLLSPERENGNITTHDYEVATAFLPGLHRHYRKAGTIVGAGIPMAFARNRSWTNLRTFFTITTCGLVGTLSGHCALIFAHLTFLRSIENLEGFSRAMANIQTNIGGVIPESPVIAAGVDDWVLKEAAGTASELSKASPRHRHTTTPPMSPKSTSPTRWDQIRSANSRKSSNSSWDVIRQNHERTRILYSSSNDGQTEGGLDERNDDRAAEQARFDAMLEKERNISK